MVVLSNPEDAPRADLHAGCCGSRGRKTPGDPIGHAREDPNPPSWAFPAMEFERIPGQSSSHAGRSIARSSLSNRSALSAPCGGCARFAGG
jgi:hypothetical protein